MPVNPVLWGGEKWRKADPVSQNSQNRAVTFTVSETPSEDSKAWGDITHMGLDSLPQS